MFAHGSNLTARRGALPADRAAAEFRGYPPSAIKKFKNDLGDNVTIRQHDWNCDALIWFNHKKKPFDDRKPIPEAADVFRWRIDLNAPPGGRICFAASRFSQFLAAPARLWDEQRFPGEHRPTFTLAALS